MRKISVLFIFVSFALLISCNSNQILKEFYSFSNLEWNKSEKVEYKVNVSDNINYDLKFPFRYVYGNPYKTISINIDIESPSGNIETINHKFDIMDEANMYIGEGAGDIWDLETIIKSNYKFAESGEYKFTIYHNMPDDVFPFVMEIGLVIEKIEK